MIEIIANIKGISQKYSVDSEGKRHVDITLKAEVKDGVKKIADISKFLNKPVHFNIEEMQPGLIDDKE